MAPASIADLQVVASGLTLVLAGLFIWFSFHPMGKDLPFRISSMVFGLLLIVNLIVVAAILLDGFGSDEAAEEEWRGDWNVRTDSQYIGISDSITLNDGDIEYIPTKVPSNWSEDGYLIQAYGINADYSESQPGDLDCDTVLIWIWIVAGNENHTSSEIHDASSSCGGIELHYGWGGGPVAEEMNHTNMTREEVEEYHDYAELDTEFSAEIQVLVDSTVPGWDEDETVDYVIWVWMIKVVSIEPKG